MKQNIWLSLFALCLLFLASAKQTFALDNNQRGLQISGPDSVAGMAVRVNAHRADADLPLYAPNQALANAAQQVADHMAATEFTSHYDGNGANPSQRALQAGYADHVTEIIYGGFGGADAAWAYWTENELHNGLILSEDYHEFGVGMATGVDSGRFYWAIMFGTGHSLAEATAVATNVPDPLTKLPGAPDTAVSSPSPAASRLPAASPTAGTAVTQTAPSTRADETPDAIAANETSGNTTGGAPQPANPPPQENDGSPWLILTAAFIILAGIVFFYFPRARWARSSS